MDSFVFYIDDLTYFRGVGVVIALAILAVLTYVIILAVKKIASIRRFDQQLEGKLKAANARIVSEETFMATVANRHWEVYGLGDDPSTRNAFSDYIIQKRLIELIQNEGRLLKSSGVSISDQAFYKMVDFRARTLASAELTLKNIGINTDTLDHEVMTSYHWLRSHSEVNALVP